MIRSLRALGIVAVPTLLVLSLPALTQAPALNSRPGPLPAAPNTPETKTRMRTVNYSADQSFRYPDGRVMLNGHVHFFEGNTHLYADRLIYNPETRKGEAIPVSNIRGGSIGRPQLKDDLHTLTADRLTFDLSSRDPLKRVVSAIGNVRFVAKPDPNAKKKDAPVEKNSLLPRKVQEETVLTSNRMDYYYRSQRGVAQGNLKMVQGKRWLTGDQAIYYKRHDTVVVNDNVKGEDEKGRTFAAENIKILLAGDSETIEANKYTGTFILEEDEDPTPEQLQNSPEEAPPIFPGSDEAAPASTLPPTPPGE